jgi:hypothetical protein
MFGFLTRKGRKAAPQAENGLLLTPADSDFAATILDGGVAYGLYVGGAGNVRVTMLDGADLLFSGVAAGTFMPVVVKRVWTTNTTATLIIGLY